MNSMGKHIDEIGFGGLKLLQDTEGFCYGTDAVLLAYMVRSVKDPKLIMDLGTGNGVVPLIISATTDAKIYGVEIQERASALARESVRLNNLDGRIKITSGNVKDIGSIWREKGQFDVVTMNPPYQEVNGGLISRNKEKAIARQEIEGQLKDFLKAADYLLKMGGHLFMVHRPSRLTDIICELRDLRIEPKELRLVTGKPKEKPNILMLHAVKGGRAELKILPEMAVRNNDGSFTEEMIKAYK